MRLDSSLAGQPILPTRRPVRVRPLGWLTLAASVSLGGCLNLQTQIPQSEGHIALPPKAAGEALEPVRSSSFAVPAPKPVVKPQT
jgi:hypothetical protein